MKKRDGIIWFSVIVVLVLVVVLFRDKIHFDWATFWQQLKHANPWHIGAGIALTYGTYWLRAMRWAVFVSPTKKVSAGSLLGSQFIGFTAVAVFGRLADLTRPYLVAQRTSLSLSSQVAVYTIERMFDLGAAATIFSCALAFTPKTMPHHELFIRTGLLSLGATLAIAVFAVVVRVSGGAVAGFARMTLGRLSKPVAESIATKIVGFRDGLNALSSWRDFGVVVLLSLGDDRRGLCRDSACVRGYAGAGGANLFASDAVDGGKYRRIAAAAADRGVVHPDCGYGGGNARVLRRTD